MYTVRGSQAKIRVKKFTTNPTITAATALVAMGVMGTAIRQPTKRQRTKHRKQQGVTDAAMEAEVVQFTFPSTSMSGMVPATAPQIMARFPIRRPNTTSPTAAPNTI